MIKNIALFVLTVLVIFLLVFSRIQANEAEKQTRLAVEYSLKAKQQHKLAEMNARMAQENAEEAKRQAERMREILKECQEGR